MKINAFDFYVENEVVCAKKLLKMHVAKRREYITTGFIIEASVVY